MDGDADRCFFVDDTGEFVPGDFITALIAESMLKSTRAPRSSTTSARRAPCRTSSSARAAGRSRAASATPTSSTGLRQENALFAGEVSGHYYFRDFYGVDTGIVPALVVLELVSRAGGKLSELLAPLQERYHLSGEMNTKVSDVPLKLQELKERFGPTGAGGELATSTA